jgi:hypothetical protein
MANLTISFTAPAVPPADGYIVQYRAVGDASYTTVNPNPTSSPVVISGVDTSKAYEGSVQCECTPTNKSTIATFNVGALAVLDPFDYMVIRYKNNNGGTDMDTGTGFVTTGTDQDIDYTANTNWVGYSKPATTPYLNWGGDNTSGGGVEAILVNFKQFIADHGSLPSVIKIRLHSWWYSTMTSGSITLELQTWKDGTAPVANPSAYDFTKTDGTQVDLIDVPITVNCVRGSAATAIGCLEKVAEVVYDTSTKSASLVTITGGCTCSGSTSGGTANP